MPVSRTPFLLLLVTALGWTMPAEALRFRVINTPPPMLQLSIGSGGSHIDRVSFKIKSTELGNGVPVDGKPPVHIILANRAAPANSRTAVLTVDSSVPLRNDYHTVPLTAISWTTSDGEIPSGRYDGSGSQFLLSFENSQLIRDKHEFFYDNASILEAGTYEGRVTYTLTMP
jgi:hypothetical protein